MHGTMTAARVHGPDTIKVEEIPIPEIGPVDALVKIETVYINGGDLLMYHGWRPPGKYPIIPLHEMAGVIEEVGESVIDWKKGDRVVIDPTITCDRADCIYCGSDNQPFCPYTGFMGMFTLDTLTDYGQKIWEQYPDGAFAQYMKAPAKKLVAIPDNVSFEVAAKMLNIAVGYRAALTAQIMPGDTVIIDAAAGTSGSCAVKCALLFNPAKIICVDRREAMLEKMKEWAPDIIEAVPSEKEDILDRVMEITKGCKADSLIDYSPPGSGNTSFKKCIRGLRNRGRGVFVGASRDPLELPFNYLMNTGVTLTGSISYPTTDVATVLKLTSQGKLDWSGLITHRFPISKAVELFETLDKKIGDPMWILGLPQEK
jgi:threonine dehydrogenase-like Zn-dependent dehydrogenase